MALKDESRMQAYGWSLPNKSKTQPQSSTSTSPPSKTPSLAISVPVPVYCRPLFESDTNLKLSSSSTITLSFDQELLKDCGQLIESSTPFSYFKSKPSSYTSFGDENTKYKTSCIWICNLNEQDTHVSILDANKPSDILTQFTVKGIKVYCVQSVAGLLKGPSKGAVFNAFFETQKQRILAKEINVDKEFENVTFVEGKSRVEDHKSGSEEEASKTLSSVYPTMWMGSQEGLYLNLFIFFFLFKIMF